jgi:hypothetical protein
MLALSLRLTTALAAVPALSGALPPLPPGWSFLTFDGSYLLFDGQYLIAETGTP